MNKIYNGTDCRKNYNKGVPRDKREQYCELEYNEIDTSVDLATRKDAERQMRSSRGSGYNHGNHPTATHIYSFEVDNIPKADKRVLIRRRKIWHITTATDTVNA